MVLSRWPVSVLWQSINHNNTKAQKRGMRRQFTSPPIMLWALLLLGSSAALLAPPPTAQAAISVTRSGPQAVEFAPRGREFDTFANVHMHRNATQTDAEVTGLAPPMTSPPSALPGGLPFLFIHLPKNAGTSIRQVKCLRATRVGRCDVSRY